MRQPAQRRALPGARRRSALGHVGGLVPAEHRAGARKVADLEQALLEVRELLLHRGTATSLPRLRGLCGSGCGLVLGRRRAARCLGLAPDGRARGNGSAPAGGCWQKRRHPINDRGPRPHRARRALRLMRAVADCQALLGLHAGGGSFQLANVRLEVRAGAEGHTEGLAALAFATSDGAKAQRLLQQRALPVAAEADGTLHIAPPATHGVHISLVPRTGAEAPRSSPPVPGADGASCVSGLDHVVIRTPNPERAVALYAGRLGLSLRLDRSEPKWGARLLFFRCGDLVVEVVHDLEVRPRRWARQAVGPLLARPRRRQGACAAARGRRRGFRHPQGPPPRHRGLHREEPHGERADADARRCARMKRKRPLARPPRIDPSRGAVTGSGGTWPSRCCW